MGSGGDGETGGAPFKMFPPVVEFVQDHHKDGTVKPKRCTITIQNLRQRLLTLRFSPPKTAAWRMLNKQPVVQVAGGLEYSFEVEFVPPKKVDDGLLLSTETNTPQEYHDRAVILSPDCKVELGLHALVPKPGLQVSGDLDLGLQVINTSTKRTLTVTNTGQKANDFEVDQQVLGLDLTVEPSKGTLEPGASCQLEATFSFGDLGVISEDLVINGSGATDLEKQRRLRVGCTVIEHSFQILERGGALVNELKFGSLNFNDKMEAEIELLNNGPTPVTFRSFILTKEDHIIKQQYDEARKNEEEGAEVASYMMGAKLRKVTSKNLLKAFHMCPETASIEPFEACKLTVKFNPRDAPPETGFRAKELPGKLAEQDYEYIVSFDMEGTSSELEPVELPVFGKGVKAIVEVGPRTDIDFGELMTHEWADFPITIKNKQQDLPVHVVTTRSSYFACEPAKSVIPPLSSMPVNVRYKPKVMGNHREELSVILTSATGLVLDKVPLMVRGSCSRVGPKPALVGGTDKLPEDFQKEPRYADPDQANWERMEIQKAITFKRPNPYNQGHEVQSFKMTYTKEEAMRELTHKDKYTDFIRTSRATRVTKGKSKKEDELNIGLDQTKTLKAPEFTPEPVPTKLLTPDDALAGKSCKPRNRLPMDETDISLVQQYPAMPETLEEKTECAVELTEGQIASLVVGPNVVDFGKISACSVNTQHLAVTNHLRQHILVMVGARTVEELDKTEVTSICIPGNRTVTFPLKLSVADVQAFKTQMEYCINGSHMFKIDVVADVVPVTLDASEDHLNFAFSAGDWVTFVEKTILLDNPHSFDAEFECRIQNKVFSVDMPEGYVKARSSREIVVRWEPVNTEPGTNVEGMEIVCKGGVQPHKRVMLRGELPEGKLSFAEKSLDFGACGVGVVLKRSVTIKNASPRDCNYHVNLDLLPDRVKVNPVFGTVPGNGTAEIEVTIQPKANGAVAKEPIVLDVRGGKSIKLPLKGTAYVPEIEVMQDEFDFGKVYLGGSVKQTISLKNLTGVGASLRVDLKSKPHFSLILPQDNWSAKLYDTCPLVEDGTGKAARALFDKNLGPTYDIFVAPKHTLEMLLMFKPTKIESHAFEMPLVMTGKGAVGEHRRAVVAVGTQPEVIIKPGVNIDFGKDVVQSTQQKRFPRVIEAKMTTNLDTDYEFEFGKPTTEAEEGGKGVFAVVPSSGTLRPGQELVLGVEFLPKDVKHYKATVPLFRKGEDTPYLSLEITGSGMDPGLTFDTTEVVIPAVPLGQKAEAVFEVVNQGFDNLEVSYRMPADSARLPLSIELLEGNLIGIAKERLPVVVSFTSPKPLSFTTKLDFLDTNGKSYSINISGTTDNSLMSISQFFDANQNGLQLVEDGKTGPLMLEDGEYDLPESNLDAIGPNEPTNGLFQFLSATTSILLDPENMFSTMAQTRGKQLIELVEILSSKPFKGKTGKLSGKKKEALDQIHLMFDNLLSHLKSHGALLNSVRAYHLLSLEDFKTLLMLKDTSAALGHPQDIQEAAHLRVIEPRFDEIQHRAYSQVIYQTIRVFVGSRVTPKKLLSQPPAGAAVWPPAAELVASNIFSTAESVLLAWASAHYLNRFPNSYVRCKNFDDSFRSGLVLISLMTGHWPALEEKLNELRRDPHEESQWKNNQRVALEMWSELPLSYELTEEDMQEARPLNSLLLMLYLFQSLPQLLPLTTIDFAARLKETQVKTIELTNPSRKLIAYNAKLVGSTQFAIEEAIVKLDPGTSLQFPVSLTPIANQPCEAKLILFSRREGSAAPASTMVFNLHGVPRTRSPLKRMQFFARSYELKQIEIPVTNPFQSDVDLTIQLLPEMAEDPPKPKTPPSTDKKRRGETAKKKTKPKKEAPKDDQSGLKAYPEPFGSEKSRMKLKFGQTDVLKMAFMPWREGTYYCTVMFTSQMHGQFCYELCGEASPPDPSIRQEYNVHIDGSQMKDLEIPYFNKALEDAKRLFLEKHPASKRKDQTNLVQGGFQAFGDNGHPVPGSITEVVYAVQQNNPNVDVEMPVLVLHENPEERASSTGRSPMKGQTPNEGSNKPPPVATNHIRLKLSPKGTGLYPVKVILTSPYDVRTLLINFNAANRGRTATLEFDAPARKAVIQEVPLVNNGEGVLEVRSRMTGGAGEVFSAPSRVDVPPKQTVSFPVKFCGPLKGDYSCKLELSIPKTGEQNVYNLVGTAGEPVPESHIKLEMSARSEFIKKVTVHNPTKKGEGFKVFSDLSFVSGRESIQVEGGSSKDYKMHLNPYKSGKYTGSITFAAADDGPYVWHTLEVTVLDAAPIDRLEISAAVRKAASVSIVVDNPLQTSATFEVDYLGPGVLGPHSLEVPASSSSSFEFYFAPLAEGVDMGRIQFTNKELGEFWYELVLTAQSPESERVTPEMRAPLCGRVTRTLTVPNPMDTEVVFKACSSNPRVFAVTPAEFVVPALGDGQFTVEYSPSTLSAAETATLKLSSPDAGQFDYEVVGTSDPPEVQEEISVATVPGGQDSAQISWHNPTSEAVTVSASIREDGSNPLVPGIFSLLSKTTDIVVEPMSDLTIPLQFAPSDLRDFFCVIELMVQIPSQREPVAVKFPVKGMAETPPNGTVFRYSTKARKQLEAPLEVVLSGMSAVSPTDVFSIELQTPPEHKYSVNAALEIKEVNTSISSPSQPLQYTVIFKPQKMFSCIVDLIVSKKSGGRWRFEIDLEATKPDSDGELRVEAEVGQIGRLPLPLQASGPEAVPFRAYMTPESDLDLDVFPKTGHLLPAPPTSDPEADSPAPPLVVAYRNKDYGRNSTGTLIIETPESEYAYKVIGCVTKYVSPSTKNVASKLTTKQDPAVLTKLKGTAPRKDKNFVAAAARARH